MRYLFHGMMAALPSISVYFIVDMVTTNKIISSLFGICTFLLTWVWLNYINRTEDKGE